MTVLKRFHESSTQSDWERKHWGTNNRIGIHRECWCSFSVFHGVFQIAHERPLLYAAVEKKNGPMVEAILARGADPNHLADVSPIIRMSLLCFWSLSCFYIAPIHIAASDPALFQMMLDHNGNPRTTDTHGVSFLLTEDLPFLCDRCKLFGGLQATHIHWRTRGCCMQWQKDCIAWLCRAWVLWYCSFNARVGCKS